MHEEWEHPVHQLLARKCFLCKKKKRNRFCATSWYYFKSTILKLFSKNYTLLLLCGRIWCNYTVHYNSDAMSKINLYIKRNIYNVRVFRIISITIYNQKYLRITALDYIQQLINQLYFSLSHLNNITNTKFGENRFTVYWWQTSFLRSFCKVVNVEIRRFIVYTHKMTTEDVV